MQVINPINPKHSRPLDVHLWSDHPEINGLIRNIFNSFSEEEKRTIEGRSNNKGRASGRTHLKVVLLDLYVAWKDDPELSIGVARGNGAYNVGSRYNALFISPKIRPVIDLLIKLGLIDSVAGSHNRQGNRFGNHTSRIRASEKLGQLFQGLTLEPFDLSLNHNEECIILRKQDVKESGSGTENRQVSEDYKDTDKTVAMRRDLTKYNELLSRTYIDIPALEEPFIERKLSNGQIQRVPINQTRKFVRRIFSRNSWELNGRFYGGFWQQIGKEFRKQIVINSSPTIEVDYKGLHVSLLSAKKGIVDIEDHYELGALILPEAFALEQRDIVKSLLLTAINAKSPKSAFAAFRNSQPQGSIAKTLTNGQLSKLLQAFISKHPHLEEDICSDKGIELMYLDSQITSYIINKFTELNKPILSVHDSYIVGSRDTELLRHAMKAATIKLVGCDLSVNQTGISYSQIHSWRHLDRDYYLDTFQSVFIDYERTTQYKDRYNRFRLSMQTTN